jgi:RimJ/RimL family protein N-acetyltransferase
MLKATNISISSNSAGVQIRQLRVEDARQVAELHITGIQTGFISSLGIDFVTAVYQAIAKIKNDDTRRDFVIENKDGQPIGIIGLVKIDDINKTAECYCVISERDFWGKGIASIAHSMIIEWVFDALGLEKIWAEIRPENIAIRKLWKNSVSGIKVS